MRDSKRDPLAGAFSRRLACVPSAPLVVSPRRRATAADVDGLAAALAARLAAGGVRPGELVALLAPNGPAFLAALLAVRRAGAAALLLDARAPAAARRRTVADLAAGHLLATADGWSGEAESWTLEALPSSAGGAEPLPAEVAVVKLTSGSTGEARGIATPAATLLADDEALVATMGIGPDDRLLATIPFSHSYGLSSLVVPALVRGLPLVLPEDDGPFGPLAAAAALGATVFPTVPAYLAALGRLAEPPALPPTLRLVMTAGAPLAAAASVRFRERFGLPVHVFYGASECGGICYDREGGAAERGTVGAPVEGVTVTVEGLAADGGGAGRVVVRSPAVASGYLPESDPRLTDGRFETADLAVWRDGELALAGRLDDLINVKGKKVNPREVEQVLAGLAHVDDVRVLGVTGGDGACPVVRAVIACRPGSLATAQVVAWCRARLVEHQVPRSVVLVEALPRTDRGKIDLAALARL
jgi:acyl-coenzyme A synthetase/AMP-(fatty) acid ligase